MVTYWYDTGSNIQLYPAPQQPPPGRYLGMVELTRSQRKVLERMIEEERAFDVQEPGRMLLAGGIGGAVG
jgi:hypothetical protein